MCSRMHKEKEKERTGDGGGTVTCFEQQKNVSINNRSQCTNIIKWVVLERESMNEYESGNLRDQ